MSSAIHEKLAHVVCLLLVDTIPTLPLQNEVNCLHITVTPNAYYLLNSQLNYNTSYIEIIQLLYNSSLSFHPRWQRSQSQGSISVLVQSESAKGKNCLELE